MCKTRNITQGALIRHIYELIKEHEGKDFNDLNDLFTKLYPKHNSWAKQAFYDTSAVEKQ